MFRIKATNTWILHSTTKIGFHRSKKEMENHQHGDLNTTQTTIQPTTKVIRGQLVCQLSFFGREHRIQGWHKIGVPQSSNTDIQIFMGTKNYHLWWPTGSCTAAQIIEDHFPDTTIDDDCHHKVDVGFDRSRKNGHSTKGFWWRFYRNGSHWKWHHVEQTWLRSRIMACMGVSRCCFQNLAGFCTQLRKHPKYPEGSTLWLGSGFGWHPSKHPRDQRNKECYLPEDGCLIWSIHPPDLQARNSSFFLWVRICIPCLVALSPYKALGIRRRRVTGGSIERSCHWRSQEFELHG